ncbi:MAG: hypothetical protein ACFBSE_21665 [Prochloraceae cyanobacterium]
MLYFWTKTSGTWINIATVLILKEVNKNIPIAVPTYHDASATGLLPGRELLTTDP